MLFESFRSFNLVSTLVYNNPKLLDNTYLTVNGLIFESFDSCHWLNSCWNSKLKTITSQRDLKLERDLVGNEILISTVNL